MATGCGSRVGFLGRAVSIAVALIVVAGAVPAPRAMSATAGLVAAYGFDEGSGTAIGDASGNGNAGTI